MTLPVLLNPIARRIFLDRHALADAPTGPAKGEGLAALIDRIGFVQVDSINTVERAHHMILFARRQSYKPENLKHLLETNRALFEHWTHDASILPCALFPHWQHRFARDTHRLASNWRSWFRDGYEAKFDEILRRISDDGPVTSTDVGIGEARGKTSLWFAREVAIQIAVIGGFVVAALIVTAWLRHSRFGARLQAVRDNEDAARAVGVNPFSIKLAAITLSGAFMGAAHGR